MVESLALRTFRGWAFAAQRHLCFYCKHPMWSTSAAAFAASHCIAAKHAHLYQLTAEHLHPRQDGGKDTPANIVAACAHCNHQRHEMFPRGAPDPATYEIFVLLNVAAGMWHDKMPTQ